MANEHHTHRSVYRLVELSDGWNGRIIETQWLFGMLSIRSELAASWAKRARIDVFDGTMIALAMFTLNIFHPGWLLVPEEKAAQWEKHVGLPGGSPAVSKNEVSTSSSVV